MQLLAIPSPDVVINLFASAAQALGLLTVALGGLFVGRRKIGLSAKTRPGSRWAFRVSATLLVLVTVAFGLFYLHTRDERNRRLRVNLVRDSTENGRSVGDSSLKTLSFSKQVTHPLGVTTEELRGWIEQGVALNLIDVREPEEVEEGRIRGSVHRRYPDLERDPESLPGAGKQTLLLCHSGNRSSELVDEFRGRGIECRFLVGGYEKWIAEGGTLVDTPGRRDELRSLPSFPNEDALLDTPNVEEAVEERGAIFVDVRYPAEYRAGHLPGAVNIPLRKLPSDEMWARLKELPKRPVIVPCYDKRSSFYGKILGLRLHRLGYEFCGRYTVPHEFFAPRQERAHVAHWKEIREGRTVFRSVASLLAKPVEWLHERFGSLALAIVCFVLALRLAVLPLAVKAERDRLRQRALAPRVSELKEQLSADPARRSQAILALYRKAGITPLRNLAGTTVQLVLFLVALGAVDVAAAGSTEGFLWLPSLREPDPLRLLPFAVGVAVFAMVCVGVAKPTRKNLVAAALAGALLVLLAFDLRAAVGIYLVTSLALLLVQNVWIRISAEGGRADAGQSSRKRPGSSVVPLRHAHRVPGTGNKAARLGRMLEAGLPVPDGFVLTNGALSRPGNGRESGANGQVDRQWRRIRAEVVAVRSSGLNEDGTEKSYAGVFDSVLNVTRDRLPDAVRQVRGSLAAPRASSYSGNGQEQGGILVQRMVSAEYAGVVFTRHPGDSARMLVEMVEGLGDELVSGHATPRQFEYSRYSARPLHAEDPAIDLKPLVSLAGEVERLFDAPQDIEWAYAQGRFQLLQARDITAQRGNGQEDRDAILDARRHELLELAKEAQPAEIVLAQTELSELLPRPTPFSLALMNEIWAAGGSVDIACRDLGVPYTVGEESAPYAVDVFGALYVNRLEERRRSARGIGALTSFRLSRRAESMVARLEDGFLPAYRRDVRLREAVDLRRFDLPELVRLFIQWKDRFVREIYAEVHRVNVAAEFHFGAATRRLERAGLDPGHHLGHESETRMGRATAVLARVRRGEAGLDEFLALAGHRAPHDFELAEPRYAEDLPLVRRMVDQAVDPGAPAAGPPALRGDRILALCVGRARRFQVLKEDAKHEAVRELALLRRILVELGRRIGLGDDIFFLLPDEVARISEGEFANEDAPARASRRKSRARACERVVLPSEIRLEELEDLRLANRDARRPVPAEGLRGLRVSGNGVVSGRLRVIHDAKDLGEFQPGEILVTRFTDPSWMPVFPLARGIIAEVGGWLSHAAILAREYGLPSIVGSKGALTALHTGDLVRMHEDGAIEPFADRRVEERLPGAGRATLHCNGTAVPGRIADISPEGARVMAKELAFRGGESLQVRMKEHGTSIPAHVVRVAPDHCALRFAARIELDRFQPGDRP